MDKAAEAIEALKALVTVVGWWPSVLGVALLVGVGLGFQAWKERRIDKRASEAIAAKDQTIERISGEVRDLKFEVFRLRKMDFERAYFLAYGRKYEGPKESKEGASGPEEHKT